MKTEEKIKLVNQGYMMGIALPLEFKNAIQAKMNELKTNSKDQERWTALSHGLEIALKERVIQRQQELTKARKGQTKEKGRER